MYFIIGMVLLAIGYVVRVTGLSIVTSVDNRKFTMEGSFVFITMGIYFLAAVIFRKAAAWVVGGVAFVAVGFFQKKKKMEFGWYIDIYESNVGRIVIGGPFQFRLFIYIFIGMILGAALEIVLRQYNKVGL